MKYKTLNNHVAKFIIENSVISSPRFTFIRLYNAFHDEEFEEDVFKRLYSLVAKIISECHDIDDVRDIINELPPVVKSFVERMKHERRCLK